MITIAKEEGYTDYGWWNNQEDGMHYVLAKYCFLCWFVFIILVQHSHVFVNIDRFDYMMDAIVHP
jgi:hypothetical protein